ncbi:hypothetical protein [Actinokineospora inagensis]|uniref:hypothetical protein n=1 Tax=Actinokineospora inagensis TaxID=103730 RepID=UPI000403A4C5|nr:hypothetical protein [Actinokineospora inagensis]
MADVDAFVLAHRPNPTDFDRALRLLLWDADLLLTREALEYTWATDQAGGSEIVVVQHYEYAGGSIRGFPVNRGVRLVNDLIESIRTLCATYPTTVLPDRSGEPKQ